MSAIFGVSRRPAGSASQGLLLTAGALYYWAYLYARALLPATGESASVYLATVLPIAVLACTGVSLSLLRSNVAPGGPVPFGLLIAFIALTSAASLARRDWNTALAAGLLALTLLWLCSTRQRLGLATLNRLFVMSIITGALFHALGWSDYGLLPGQYAEGEDRGITWRVSLFPYVPESGFFALIVLLANQFAGKGRMRVVYAAAAFYFLLFSGVRSALICWLLCMVLVVADRVWAKKPLLRRRNLRLAASAALIGLFVMSVVSSAVLQLFPALSEGAVGSYLFRAAADDLDSESITQSVYRSWLWARHLDIFVQSPLLGAGSYEFSALVGDSLIEGHADSGSESFVTFWLSRVGLLSLPLFAFLLLVTQRAAADASLLALCCCIVFWVAGLAYGSFLVPYNFMFLVLFSIALVKPPRAGQRLARP